MPKDYKTNVIIDHQVKGVDKLKQGGDRVSSSLGKIRNSLNTLKKEYSDTQKALDNLTKSLERQTSSAEKLAKRKEELASSRIAQREAQRQKASRGAFTQGLIQGGFPIPSMFLQRGPGFGKQLAGMAVGRTLGRGFGMGQAGLMGSFTGVAGLQQFLSSIPYVGGLLSGQVGKLAGYAEQNIGYQKTELEAAPYLSRFQDLRKMISMGGSLQGLRKEQEALLAGADVEKTARYKDLLLSRPIEKKHEEIIAEEKTKVPKDLGVVGRILEFLSPDSPVLRKLATSTRGSELTEPTKLKASVQKAREEIDTFIIEGLKEDTAKIVSKSSRLKSALRGVDPLAGLGDEGARLMGLNKEDTLRFLSSIVQVGGGVATGEQAKGLRESAFGARTLWGVGANVSGAFLQAGRRGGITGGESANTSFINAINSGVSLGLEGSEINTWLETIAQRINQFQQTGIPINVNSITQLAIGIGKAGLGGTRSIALAQNATQYLQGLGGRGITSGSDLIMLQLLGGWKGGGVKGYREARSRMEEMNFGEGELSGTLSKYLSFVGGDQATKAEMLQRLFTQWGAKGSVKEFDWLAAQLSGGKATKEQKVGIDQFIAEQLQGATELTAIQKAGGITGAAAATVAYRAPNVREMAHMQNQQIAVGGKVVSVMQSLEKNALNTSEAFANLAKGPLLLLSETMGSLSATAMDLVGSFTNLIESVPSILP
jgi:hypothetical protein